MIPKLLQMLVFLRADRAGPIHPTAEGPLRVGQRRGTLPKHGATRPSRGTVPDAKDLERVYRDVQRQVLGGRRILSVGKPECIRWYT